MGFCMLDIRGINKSELNDMLKKYDIGKKPLSVLLGWGQTTVLIYSRMEDIPQNEYTERLYYLYRTPSEYIKLLLNNYDRITEVAFKKSLRAVSVLTTANKILVISQIIIDISNENVSQARVQNVLFWSQIISLVMYGSCIFNEVYQPTKGNYPYKSVTDYYNSIGFIKIDSIKDKRLLSYINELTHQRNMSVISKREFELISFVYDMFSWYGEKALVQLLAAERFRLCGPAQNRKRTASHDTVRKIYTEVFEQAKIKRLSDIEGFMAKRMEALRKTTLKLTK